MIASVRMPRRRVALLIVPLFLLAGIVVSRTFLKKRAAATLPKTIEEYRAVLQQPDFGMYYLDFFACLAGACGDFDNGRCQTPLERVSWSSIG